MEKQTPEVQIRQNQRGDTPLLLHMYLTWPYILHKRGQIIVQNCVNYINFNAMGMVWKV